MRRGFFFYVSLLGCLTSLWAMGASNKYGMAGCGLGSAAFGKTSKGGQIFAATTNGTSFNQYSGISTGTSNCEPTKEQIAQLDFVTGNLASLEKEMSQGSGETLAAFGKVLGCKDNVLPTFQRQMQKSYTRIFSRPAVTEILSTTKDALKSNPVLSQSCTNA